jgi:hypothetical protein
VIIFDLDGTLVLNHARKKFLEQDPKDWDEFFAACNQDEVNDPIAKIYCCLWDSGYSVKIVTGRPEMFRQKTLRWFDEHRLPIVSSNLHMRKDGDTRHDVIVKPELVTGFADRIECIFEDRNSMVRKWRELGYCCIQVADGDF